MSVLVVENLSKLYIQPSGAVGGGVREVDLAVEKGEFFTLLGPSGCGKTTLLRSIAGLEDPQQGRIAIDGTPVFDAARGESMPPNKRRLGMVFQSYAIWPHMSVFENVAFPLRTGQAGKLTRAAIAERIERTLDVVGLGGMSGRAATAMSGGQQQRLALARALVGEPRLLLLDEPLSNLDTGLRERMRVELRRLQREVGITTIYVTHDQSEALAMSDRIAVMRAGRIAQLGTPHDIYNTPNSLFLAQFIGANNVIDAQVARAPDGSGMGEARSSLGPIATRFQNAVAVGDPIKLMIRPEHLQLADAGVADNAIRFPGRLTSTVFLGEITELHVEVGHGIALIQRGRTLHTLPQGAEVVLAVSPNDVLALPADGEA
jgi:iron(III) transport system ATP-binding protein